MAETATYLGQGPLNQDQGWHSHNDTITNLKDWCLSPKLNDRLKKLGKHAGTRGALILNETEGMSRFAPDGLAIPEGRITIRPFEPDNWILRDHASEDPEAPGYPVSGDQVWAIRLVSDNTNKDNKKQNRSTLIYSGQLFPVNAPLHTAMLTTLAPRKSIEDPSTLDSFDGAGEHSWVTWNPPINRLVKVVDTEPAFLDIEVYMGIQSFTFTEQVFPYFALTTFLFAGKPTTHFENAEGTFTKAVAINLNRNSGFVRGRFIENTTSGLFVHSGTLLAQWRHIVAPIRPYPLREVTGILDPEDSIEFGYLGLRPNVFFTSPDPRIYGPLSITPFQMDFPVCGGQPVRSPDYCIISSGNFYFSTTNSQTGAPGSFDIRANPDWVDDPNEVSAHITRFRSKWNIKVWTQSAKWGFGELSYPSLFSLNYHDSSGLDQEPLGPPGGILSPVIAPNVDWRTRVEAPITHKSGGKDGETVADGLRLGMHFDGVRRGIDEASASYYLGDLVIRETRFPRMATDDREQHELSALYSTRIGGIVASFNDSFPSLEIREQEARKVVVAMADIVEALAEIHNGFDDAKQKADDAMNRWGALFGDLLAGAQATRPRDVTDFRRVEALPQASSRPPFTHLPVNRTGGRRQQHAQYLAEAANNIVSEANRRRMRRLLKLPPTADDTPRHSTNISDSMLDIRNGGLDIVFACETMDFNSGDFTITADAIDTAGIQVSLTGRLPTGYMRGAKLAWVSGTSITSGTAAEVSAVRDGLDTVDIRWTGTLTASTAIVGVGGLDVGSVAANTWYAVHAIAKNAGADSALLLSTSATAPTLPASYTKFRRIGWVRTKADSNIRRFGMSFSGTDRLYGWVEERTELQVLFGGTATTYTDVDVSSLTAPGSALAQIVVLMDTVSATDVVELRPDGSIISAPIQFFQLGQATTGIIGFTGYSTIGPAAGIIEYRITKIAGTPTVDIFVLGFQDSI